MVISWMDGWIDGWMDDEREGGEKAERKKGGNDVRY